MRRSLTAEALRFAGELKRLLVRHRRAARIAAAALALTIAAAAAPATAQEGPAPVPDAALAPATSPPPSVRPARRPDRRPEPPNRAPDAAARVAPRPVLRPAAPPRRAAGSATAAQGPLCGDARLVGRPLPPISEALRGSEELVCGAAAPIALERVAGVEIRPAATTTCAFAEPLADWVETTLAPASVERYGAPVVAVRNAASYACRTRNHRDGAKLSEHGRARALDISEVFLADGRSVTVLDGWSGSEQDAAFLRDLWYGACDRFGTVLGPDSDVHHRNHFHFDATDRRTNYCR